MGLIKKMVFLGDSITEGVGTSDDRHRYWEIISQRTGAVCKGYGISGTRIARQQYPQEGAFHDRSHFLTRVETMDKDADVVVIFGGVNDFGHGDAPFGTMADRIEDTFYGALHTLYTKLLERYSQSRIVIMTPLHYENEAAGTLRDNGTVRQYSLQQYVGAIRETAEYYSLPVLDLFRMSGLQPCIPAIRERYMPDGLHPNDNGHTRIADCLLGFLHMLV